MLWSSDYPPLSTAELELCERLAEDPVVQYQLSVSEAEFESVLALAGCTLAKNPAHPGKNWVTKTGGLPDYICRVARAIHRRGIPVGSAIAIAVSRMKAWQHSKKTSPKTKAKAAAGEASWEAKRAESHAMSAAKKVKASADFNVGGGTVSALDRVLAFAGVEPSEEDELWLSAELALAASDDDEGDDKDGKGSGSDRKGDDDDDDADVKSHPVYKRVVGKMGHAKAAAFVKNMKSKNKDSGKAAASAPLTPLERVIAFSAGVRGD